MKKKTNAQLKKQLWKVFATYIKLRDGSTCYTCGRRAEGQGLHAGHFIPKSAGGISLYFHEDNVHSQCATCNLFLSGNQYEYGKRLGEKVVNELYKIKQQITKNYPFEAKIEEYKRKIKELDGKDNSR